MSELKWPAAESEARCVIYDTLTMVRKQMQLPKGYFDPLIKVIMDKKYPKQTRKKRTKTT
jgi:hypothetical protein